MPAQIVVEFINTEMCDEAHSASNSNPTPNLDRMWGNAVGNRCETEGHPSRYCTTVLQRHRIALFCLEVWLRPCVIKLFFNPKLTQNLYRAPSSQSYASDSHTIQMPHSAQSDCTGAPHYLSCKYYHSHNNCEEHVRKPGI
jgi:hypothetical protein